MRHWRQIRVVRSPRLTRTTGIPELTGVRSVCRAAEIAPANTNAPATIPIRQTRCRFMETPTPSKSDPVRQPSRQTVSLWQSEDDLRCAARHQFCALRICAVQHVGYGSPRLLERSLRWNHDGISHSIHGYPHVAGHSRTHTRIALIQRDLHDEISGNRPASGKVLCRNRADLLI